MLLVEELLVEVLLADESFEGKVHDRESSLSSYSLAHAVHKPLLHDSQLLKSHSTTDM